MICTYQIWNCHGQDCRLVSLWHSVHLACHGPTPYACCFPEPVSWMQVYSSSMQQLDDHRIGGTHSLSLWGCELTAACAVYIFKQCPNSGNGNMLKHVPAWTSRNAWKTIECHKVDRSPPMYSLTHRIPDNWQDWKVLGSEWSETFWDILGALAQICSANCSMRSVTSGSLAHVRDLQFELSSRTWSAKGRRVLQSLWRTCELLACITRFPGEFVPFAPLLTSFEKCQIWHRIRTAKITALDLAMSRIFAECLCYTLYQTPHLCVISCNSYIIFGKNLDLPCPVQDHRTLNMVGVLLLSCKMLTEVGSNTFKQDLKRTLTCTNPFSLLFAHGCCK